MEKWFDDSVLDNDLNKLDADISWKKMNRNELKQKLISDMNRGPYRSKMKLFLGHSVRMGALAAVLFIGFIFISQNISKVDRYKNGSIHEEIAQWELPITDGDQTVVFTEKEQNSLESYNASKELFLTDEASFSLNLLDSTTMGEPEIIAKKEKGSVLADVLFPGDPGVVIKTEMNGEGSADLAYDSLTKEYPNALQVTSFSKPAILIESPNNRSQLFIITDKFIYTISGDNSNEGLVKTAESIQFTK